MPIANRVLPYFARMTKQCDFPTMKRNNDQITLRVAGPLRAALEDEAASEARGLSSLIRKVLIEHAANRIAERANAEGAR